RNSRKRCRVFLLEYAEFFNVHRRSRILLATLFKLNFRDLTQSHFVVHINNALVNILNTSNSIFNSFSTDNVVVAQLLSSFKKLLNLGNLTVITYRLVLLTLVLQHELALSSFKNLF